MVGRRRSHSKHDQAEHSRRIRALDLFCGAGGSSRGATLAGVEIAGAFDAWDLAAKTHAENFPSARFYLSPLEDLDPHDVAREVGKIDLILASPECTNHGPAKGNRPRCDISRNTAFQVVRFAKALKPRWLVVENVISMRKWHRYKEFTAALASLGYNIREEALNSKDFGVPQSRRRLFLLCDLRSAPPRIVAPTGRPRSARTIVNLNGAYSWSALRAPRRAQATLERAARGINALGEHRSFLLVYYGSDHAGGWQPLTRPLRTITTLDRFAIVKPTTSGHKMRMLQVDELQAAMGMDGMNLPHGSRRDRIKMIGNAVCPPVMRAVVEQLTGSTATPSRGTDQ
ncbi:MAG: DNA cytosine methyltransferase [Thermoanaerobaculia bacterium]